MIKKTVKSLEELIELMVTLPFSLPKSAWKGYEVTLWDGRKISASLVEESVLLRQICSSELELTGNDLANLIHLARELFYMGVGFTVNFNIGNDCYLISWLTIDSLIDHNFYYDGAVQSFGFKDENGQLVTSGIVAPGKYDFGKAKLQETIKVTSGWLTINGKLYIPGESCVIELGEEIKITAEVTSTYICIYG